MKVVINSCFGGFSLSPKAMNRYAELKGRKCYFFVNPVISGFNLDLNKYVEASMDEAEKAFMWYAYDTKLAIKYLNKNQKWHELSQKEKDRSNEYARLHSLYGRDIKRNDSALIQVVEELGKAANGKYADLKVVKIPNNIKWEIEEYDGNEHVVEKHRRWS